MAESTLKIVQLTITTPEKIWERCLISNIVPQVSDLEFYYQKLLGFAEAKVSVSAQSVPADFNASLLPSHEEVPADFPSYDLETEPHETERRAKYAQFIHQLCEMERARSALKTLSRSAATEKAAKRPKYTTALTEDPLHLIGYANEQSKKLERRAWVQEILREIDPDCDGGDELAVVDGAAPPVGWLVVPAVNAARHSVGSRIIFDAALGAKWERLLGTDYYPDLVVLRRLTTHGWTYEGPQSDKLLENLVHWFVASQDAIEQDGMSSYIVGMEKELNALISTLRRVKVGERLLDMSNDDDPRVQVQKIIKKLETDCLESASVDPLIQPVSAGVFHRLLAYAFKKSGIPRDVYITDDKIALTVERWARSQMGLKETAEPLIPEWKTVWDLVMRGKPSSIRLNHFLATMDSWDAVAGVGLTSMERTAIAQEWIRIYMDTQVIRGTGDNFKIRSFVLHEEIKKWCIKYIPETIFGPQLSCVNVGPVLTKKGFPVSKLKGGRYILGVRFKSLVGSGEDLAGETVATEEEVRAAAAETLKEANTVQFTTVTKDNEDGSQTKQRVVEHTVVAEKDGARIEHYFAASVTTETIDIGSV
jgi:hypothetical protein